MTLTEYITVDRDRLDLIASKAYGNPFDWSPILDNNKALPIQAEYDAGIRLVIPVQETASQITQQELLPPWKRDN